MQVAQESPGIPAGLCLRISPGGNTSLPPENGPFLADPVLDLSFADLPHIILVVRYAQLCHAGWQGSWEDEFYIYERKEVFAAVSQ